MYAVWIKKGVYYQIQSNWKIKPSKAVCTFKVSVEMLPKFPKGHYTDLEKVYETSPANPEKLFHKYNTIRLTVFLLEVIYNL